MQCHASTYSFVPPCLRVFPFRDAPIASILDTLRDEDMYDPVQRITVSHKACYMSKLLDKHPSYRKVLPGASSEEEEVKEVRV